jgi:hydroxyacylglutathione hydrolase
MPEPQRALEIVTIPCLTDNYAYLVKGPGDGEVALIDAPEAAPVEAALEARGWRLGAILLTHHHGDHTGGVARLRARYGCKVVGPAAEADRLPPLDRAVAEGDEGGTGVFRSVVIAVPGHTLGHVAYHFPAAAAVFTADSLMACGCGRIFEGTPGQMWHSLSRLAALPPETMVHSGHEYTLGNLRFALSLDPANPALILRQQRVEADRQAGRPSVPVSLEEELRTNPFLRPGDATLRRAVCLPDAPDAEVFAEIRARKDRF